MGNSPLVCWPSFDYDTANQLLLNRVRESMSLEDLRGIAKPLDEILRMPEVLRITKLCRATIYNYVNAGTFPKPVKLGARASGWLKSEVTAWLEARKAERDL